MSPLPVNLKMVIFDIDGTLYNQKKMRLYMALELALYYVVRPWKLGEIKVLMHFRREREKNALVAEMNHEIAENQYKWCQPLVNRPLVEIQRIVELWMHNKPLKHLSKCTYNKASKYIDALNKQNIITCAYSDFRGDAKLEAMNLNIQYCYSSEQKEIDVLKPNPKGINYIAQLHGIEKENILFVGDRTKLDGQCAANAGVKFYKITKETANQQYSNLLNE